MQNTTTSSKLAVLTALIDAGTEIVKNNADSAIVAQAAAKYHLDSVDGIVRAFDYIGRKTCSQLTAGKTPGDRFCCKDQ